MRFHRRTSFLVFFLAVWQMTAAEAQLQAGPMNNPVFDALLAERGDVFGEDAPAFVPIPSTARNDIETQLRNGEEVNPRDWPAVLQADGVDFCTSVVVGPNTILLAAHCVQHQGAITVTTARGEIVRGLCERAPGYERSTGRSEDWALCFTDKRLRGITFERISLAAPPPLGSAVVLIGYGCGERGGAVGTLRIGRSTIGEKPRRLLGVRPASLFTSSDAGAGEPKICGGDSGAPLFQHSGGVTRRAVIGVASDESVLDISVFAATGAEAGKTFIEDWEKRHNAEICGVDGFKAGCR